MNSPPPILPFYWTPFFQNLGACLLPTAPYLFLLDWVLAHQSPEFFRVDLHPLITVASSPAWVASVWFLTHFVFVLLPLSICLTTATVIAGTVPALPWKSVLAGTSLMVGVLVVITVVAGIIGNSVPLAWGEWFYPILKTVPPDRRRDLLVAFLRSNANMVLGTPGSGMLIMVLLNRRHSRRVSEQWPE